MYLMCCLHATLFRVYFRIKGFKIKISYLAQRFPVDYSKNTETFFTYTAHGGKI